MLYSEYILETVKTSIFKRALIQKPQLQFSTNFSRNIYSFVLFPASSFDITNFPTWEEFIQNPGPYDGKIVGGQEADIEDHPHQVSFIVNNQYFCGGFIVSKDYIVTAAHCAQELVITIL